MINVITPLVKIWRKPVKIDMDNFTSIVAGRWVEQVSMDGGTPLIKEIASGVKPLNAKCSFSAYSTSEYESQDVSGVERLTVLEGPGTIIQVDSEGYAITDATAAAFAYTPGTEIQAAYDVGVGAAQILVADLAKVCTLQAANRAIGIVEYLDAVNGHLYYKLY